MSDIPATISAISERIWSTYETWLETLLHPVTAVNRLLVTQDASEPQEQLREIWLATLFVTTIIRLPFLHFVGIGLNEFLLIDLFIYVGEQLTNVVIIYGLLRLLVRTAHFQNTLAIYTINLVYSPVTTLAETPNLYNLLHEFQMAKHDNLSPVDAATRWYNDALHAAPSVGLVHDANAALGAALTIISTILSAVVAECLAQRYGSDRWRTYLAVSLAWFLAVPSVFIWLPLQWFTFYSYIN